MNTLKITSWPWRKQQMFQEICWKIHKIQLPEWVEFIENIATVDEEISYTLNIKREDSDTKSYEITNLHELREAYNETDELFADQEWETPNPELFIRLWWENFSGVRAVINNHRTAVFQRMQENYITPAKNNTLEDELTEYLLKIEVPYSSDESLWETLRFSNSIKKNAENVLKTRGLVKNIISHINASKLKKLLTDVEPKRLHNFLNRSWKPEKTPIFVNTVDIDKLISLLNSSKYDFSSCIDDGLSKINDPLKFAEFLNNLEDVKDFLAYYSTWQNYKRLSPKLYSFIDRTNGHTGANFIKNSWSSIDSYPVQRIADLANIGWPKNILQLIQTIPQANKWKLIDIINKTQKLWNFAKIIWAHDVDNIVSFINIFNSEEIVHFIDTATEKEIDDFWITFSLKRFEIWLEKPTWNQTWKQEYIDYYKAFWDTTRDFIQENFSTYFWD